MSKIFITGSSDGLGFLTAKQLLSEGHEVVLHSRNENRKKELAEKIPDSEILVADLSDLNETISLAEKVNALGKFDAVIHNAGVYNTNAETIFNVNVLAPYVLTSLIEIPKQLVYLSSDMHFSGNFSEEKIRRKTINYSDSKLLVTMLMKAVARKNPEVFVNAVDPGWVPTKMGGKNAPDDLNEGFQTQIWLTTSFEKEAQISGKYFFHKQQKTPNPQSENLDFQERLIEICEEISGIKFNTK